MQKAIGLHHRLRIACKKVTKEWGKTLDMHILNVRSQTTLRTTNTLTKESMLSFKYP